MHDATLKEELPAPEIGLSRGGRRGQITAVAETRITIAAIATLVRRAA